MNEPTSSSVEDTSSFFVDQFHGNLRGPKKYGPNKALLRETNG